MSYPGLVIHLSLHSCLLQSRSVMAGTWLHHQLKVTSLLEATSSSQRSKNLGDRKTQFQIIPLPFRADMTSGASPYCSEPQPRDKQDIATLAFFSHLDF